VEARIDARGRNFLAVVDPLLPLPGYSAGCRAGQRELTDIANGSLENLGDCGSDDAVGAWIFPVRRRGFVNLEVQFVRSVPSLSSVNGFEHCHVHHRNNTRERGIRNLLVANRLRRLVQPSRSLRLQTQAKGAPDLFQGQNTAPKL